MQELSLARRHLCGSWAILAMLLVVTVLADFASQRLVINELLQKYLGRSDDLYSLAIWIGRIVIVSASVLAVIGRSHDLYWLFFITIGLVTIAVALEVVVMIWTFATPISIGGIDQLRDGIVLWSMNTLVFASWYWLVDTHALHPEAAKPGARRDLLFPQEASSLPGWEGWHPNAVDYLFVAFSTSTAFSSTDTVFLTRRAKVLMMWQAGVTLTIATIIVARAVNAL